MADIFSFPWEKAAMHGEAMPDGLGLTDQQAFLALSHIYALYHLKYIDRERAAAEKKKLRYVYETQKIADESNRKLAFHRAELNAATELAAAAVRKDPSPENALHLVRVLDGLAREIK